MGEIHPGAHICALYSGFVQRDRLLVAFMQEGLRHGDRCVCFVDEFAPASERQEACGPSDPGDGRRGPHLDVHPTSVAYLWAEDFSADRMLALLGPSPPSSTDDGIALLRVAGQMRHPPCEPGTAELSVYESAVTQVLAEIPGVFLCMYDVRGFGVGMLLDVLMIHSKVVLGRTVLHNHEWSAQTAGPVLTPDAGRHRPPVRLRAGAVGGGDLWLSLTGAEVRIAELVASGKTNRAAAEEMVVSPHTVDAHLKHMYLKLGIHSRVELTVLAIQHRRPTA